MNHLFRTLPALVVVASTAALLLSTLGCSPDVVDNRNEAPTTTTTDAECDPGFQDNDGDGHCEPSCEHLGWTCSHHGWCADDSGEARCMCDAGYVDDGSGHCLPDSGQDCLDPIPLTLATTVITGDTSGAGDDHDGSCQEHTGDDLVFEFELNGAVQARFHATGFDTVIYLRSDCADETSELGCSDDLPASDDSEIDLSLSAGTYYLFIDGFGSSAGLFTLSIDVTCPAGAIFDPSAKACVDDPCDPNPCNEPFKHQCEAVPPDDHACSCDPGFIDDPNEPGTCIPGTAGENCVDAIPLPLVDGSITGSTTTAADDGQGSCAGSGPDRVYTFTLTEPMRVSFTMTGYDTVLHLREQCTSPASEVACSDDAEGVHASITRILQPGSYYLFADSWSEGGDYELEFSFRTDPCAGDPCPGTPECVANADWSDYECVCPPGTLPYNTTCVDDPCDPNLCVGGNDHRDRCEPVLSSGTYNCLCNIGYMEDPGDPGGTCIVDPTAKEWAILVYLNADNNLESYGYQDIAEMQVAGSTADVDIVVLLDTYAADGGDARKLYVNQGGTSEIENLGEVDMGDWQTLADFGTWAVQAYPARHYALVLWDHGDGWKSSSQSDRQLFKAFSTDDHGSSDGISISNGDYAKALGAITAALGDKLDIIGFDACLMGMWEVAEATGPYAHTFVASEETIPLEGWSYDDFLVPLVGDPQMTAHQLGTLIVDTYYAETPENSTLSVVDLDTLPDLRTALSDLAGALLGNPTLYAAVETARQSAQMFYFFDDYRDLWDVADRIAALGGAPTSVTTAANAVVTQLGITIVHSQAHGSHPDAHGLSVYFPAHQSSMDPDYVGPGAVWSQGSTWDEFLVDFTQ